MAPTIDEIIAGGTPVFDVGTLSSSQESAKVVQDDFRQGVMGAEAVANAGPAGRSGPLDGRAAERELGAPTRRRISRRDQEAPQPQGALGGKLR